MPKVLFFSRGRGRGHAIPDISIARELVGLAPDLGLAFVSYSTGAETLVEAGHQVVDLQLPDEAPFLELSVRATRVIAAERPDLVVSHEEFAALPAAKAFGLPTILVVDFFPSRDVWQESLRYADHILFIERRGIFAEPVEVRGRVSYVGPVVRPLAVTREDRASCRRELGLPEDAKVLSVIPGAWATEQRSPVFDLLVPAFRALPFPRRRLVWIAGRDQEELSRRLAGSDEISVVPSCSPIEKLMVASDLCITKANRGTTIDLARLGVPSVSLSHGRNPIDEAIIPRIPSNIALDARGIDAGFLAHVLQSILLALQQGQGFVAATDYGKDGAAAVAAHIARRCRSAAVSSPAEPRSAA
jgi:UDP-N-acetylglucosamine:LPS N-acetylglucosamine transferase